MRKPDLTIGPEHDPQTLRWHLLRWRGWQVALHRWCRSDSDRALHDHTGDNVSILLTGRYREHLSHAWQKPGDPAYLRPRVRYPFFPYFRKAEQPHRIELYRGPVWSLWIRWPSRRTWGFYCPQGWRHWKEYVSDRDINNGVNGGIMGVSTVGRGCDD